MRVTPVPSVAWLLVVEWILASLIGWAAGAGTYGELGQPPVDVPVPGLRHR
jgi:hypothetical protein